MQVEATDVKVIVDDEEREYCAVFEFGGSTYWLRSRYGVAILLRADDEMSVGISSVEGTPGNAARLLLEARS